MSKPLLISPSVLSADFAKLGEELAALEKARADFIHLDVMDGHFVPNLTFGPPVIKALRRHSSLPFDVHLMIDPVLPYIDAFAEAGADLISIHVETLHPHRTLRAIRSLGKKAGIVLNPDTPEETVRYLLDDLDFILIMSVNPGFGGQSFIPSAFRKIRRLRQMITESGQEILIEVDGGVTADKAKSLQEAGADILVAGSAVFQGGPQHYAENISRLKGI